MSGRIEEKHRYREQVAADVAAIFPSDARTVLDVGCEDGYLINRLPQSLFVVGADRRREPLRKVSHRRTIGNIARLPFKDESFDLVMANDVLEHLSSEDRSSALSQMARVASKYIMVTVPFMEDLNLGCARCFDCGRYYHVNYHCASFGLEELRTILNEVGYGCVLQVLSGDLWQSQPSEVVFLRRLLLLDLAITEDPLCPSCGSTKIDSGASETVLNKILDKFALDLCLRERAVADRGLLRTECINLYAKHDYPLKYLGRGFLNQQGQPIPLKKECVQAHRLIFTSPEVNKREFFPTYSHLPYFLCEDLIAAGARVTLHRPVRVGFCLWKNPGDPIELRVRGIAENSATLCVWSYDTYRSYHSPVRAHVKGSFCLDLTFSRVELSRYGLVFELRTDNSPIILEEVTLLNVKGDDMAIYHNAEGQGRFLRLPGDNMVLLSLPLYGSHILELEWMRDLRLLMNPGKTVLLLDGQPSDWLRMVHELVGDLKSECDHLSGTLNLLMNEHQHLRTAYEQTFVRRLRRNLARIWGTIRVAFGRRTSRPH